MNYPTRPFILGFYGFSSSGKTTLLERLLMDLRREGFRGAVIKISGQSILLDSNGKDTDRFTKAGADAVVLITPISTTYLIQKNSDESEVLKSLQQMVPLDFIFIEGSRDKKIPKIRLGERDLRENTLLSYDGNFEKIFNFITTSIAKEHKNGRNKFEDQ
jgi:molybdopterin-guanine dinucleotide biosynthesis protein MobB